MAAVLCPPWPSPGQLPISFADALPPGRRSWGQPHPCSHASDLGLSWPPVKETSHSPCEERDGPSSSSGLSLLDLCPALSCPLSCPVTGGVEGRGVGDTENPGLAGTPASPGAAQLEDTVLQKIRSSESSAAGRQEFLFPPAPAVLSAACARALGSPYSWRRHGQRETGGLRALRGRNTELFACGQVPEGRCTASDSPGLEVSRASVFAWEGQGERPLSWDGDPVCPVF